MNPAHNIYIHVPFCVSKCKYCAFFSRAVTAPDWDTYANGIITEINHWHGKLGTVRVPTIFFGGGTPSLMPVMVFKRIMGALSDKFDIAPGAEITLESNPGTLDKNKLSDFCNAGVNRLSIGIQALDDKRLQFLGRRHNVQDALNLVRAAQGMKLRVSGDFIYGLPGDTTSDIIKLCHQINDLGLTHCSLYELTIEPNTPFSKMNLDMPYNDAMADMYNAIADNLTLPRYEVSNYAQVGAECQHNQNVWDGAPYIGLGMGAAGRVLMNDIWYEQRGAGMQCDAISNQTRAIEMVITGLRQIRGVKLTPEIQRVINSDFITQNPGLIFHTNDNRIAMTSHGMLVLDDVLEKIIR